MLCFPNSVSNFSMPVGPRTFRPPSQIMSSKTFKLQNGWVLLLCCLTLCIKHLLFFMDKYTGLLNGRECDLSCYNAEFGSWYICESHKNHNLFFLSFCITGLLRVNVCLERKLDLAAQNICFYIFLKGG